MHTLFKPEERKPEWVFNLCGFPGTIWQRYADAIGLSKLRAVFGDNWPPIGLRPGEVVFAVRNRLLPAIQFDPKDHPAGWLSLTRDQFDQKHWYMSRGVWPEYHGQGLGRAMRSYASEYVTELGGDSISIWVSTENNEQHFENVRRDDWWEPTGMLFDPKSVMFTHFL